MRHLTLPFLLGMSLALAQVALASAGGGIRTESPGVPPPETPLPEPTPAIEPRKLGSRIAQPVKITPDGCCAYPAWSADGEWVLFVDRPGEGAPAGLYSVPASGGVVDLVTERLGVFSSDWSLVAYPAGAITYVERWADGQRWSVPSGGREIHFSPDASKIAWRVGTKGIRFPDRRQRAIWISNLDGSEPRELITVHGGEFLGWLGNEHMLVSGRLAPPDPAAVWRVSVKDGAALRLMEIERPRGVAISPSGSWIALTLAFDPQPGRNGLWVLKSDGTFQERFPVYGSYRWRADGQLLLMPMEMSQPNPALWQWNPETGDIWELAGADRVELPIESNDWQVSPGGRRLVFRSSVDGALYLLQIPGTPDAP